MPETTFHTTFSTSHFLLSQAKNGSESGLRSAVSYRFGFNGQEMDNEITGQTGTHTTAMFWEYDSRLGRRWNLDPIVKPWESPYLCFSGNPVLYSDLNGDNVIVKTKKKNGEEKTKIKYRGVLIDRTGKSRSELRKIRKDIITQLEDSYSGSSETASWKIKVKLRIGKTSRGSGENRESTIQLVTDGYTYGNGEVIPKQSSVTLNGFDVLVNINSPYGISYSAGHEIGHTMGLPHILSSLILGDPFRECLFPDKSLVNEKLPIVRNLMMPGGIPLEIRGSQINESQIKHIATDYSNGLLNLENNKNGDYEWGAMSTDTPVYRFKYNPTLKLQTLIQVR